MPCPGTHREEVTARTQKEVLAPDLELRRPPLEGPEPAGHQSSQLPISGLASTLASVVWFNLSFMRSHSKILLEVGVISNRKLKIEIGNFSFSKK